LATTQGVPLSDPDAADDFASAISDLESVPLVPDQGEDEGDLSDPPSSFSASIAGKDWTAETLVLQMRKGRIDLSPSFQRRNAWLGTRKSKLIESMILGFPIPQIVLAEQQNKPGHYFVLDGKQRLLALRQFFIDPSDPRDEGFEPLRLSSLEVLSNLNGMDAEKLENSNADQFAALENHSIRTVVLGNWNSERLLLSLFLRLNTGSVQLSPQELRQALIPGRFMEWLDSESGEMSSLQRLLGNTHPDRRMVDAELALRHLAFASSPLKYRGNLKQFLDGTSEAYNSDWGSLKQQAQSALGNFDEAIICATEAFGDIAVCRKWSKVKFERALNRAVFDVQIYSLSHSHVREAIEGRGQEVLKAFQRLCDRSSTFSRSITTTTKTADAFLTRHRAWARVMKDVCEVSYDLPEPLGRN
jgi:hypothetical protein